MPPRQSLRTRRAAAEVPETKTTAAAPKKTRTAAASKRKAATADSDVDEEETEVKSEGSEAEDTKATKATPKARSTKRKAVAEDDDEVVKAEKDIKPVKKTRTAKTKIEDIMPLAKRTAVSSLKQAMYIGAHVSGAGGKDKNISIYIFSNHILPCRIGLLGTQKLCQSIYIYIEANQNQNI